MTSVKSTIISHLNDLENDTQIKNFPSIVKKLAFIQRLVVNYTSANVELSEDELEEIWNWNDWPF